MKSIKIYFVIYITNEKQRHRLLIGSYNTRKWNNYSSLIYFEKIKNLNVGEFTKPIVIPGGFLIIKLEDAKEQDKEINLEEEIQKLTTLKTNQQLNQFSTIYYNKIKNDIKIEKL